MSLQLTAAVDTASPHQHPWVLVAGAFLKTGGQDRANYALASYLARSGRHVRLAAHFVAGDLESGTLQRHIARRPLRSDLLGEPFLSRLGSQIAASLASASPRVVVNGGNCRWPDVNWVHYVHAAFNRPLDGPWSTQMRMRVAHRRWVAAERTALRSARVVVANSQRTRTDLIERVGIAPERIRVVYYGIDPQQFRPPSVAEREAVRQRLGWSNGRPVALFIGALGDTRKGFDTVLEAWSLLRQQGRHPPLLVTIGCGGLLHSLQQRVVTMSLGDDMTFLGFRTDVPELVRAADLLIAPTRYEAYGLAVHEALCCGLPAIVSADAGVAEQYPDDLRSLLLPDPADAHDLARRVQSTVDNASALRDTLVSLSARLRARTWDDMAREFVGIVDSDSVMAQRG